MAYETSFKVSLIGFLSIQLTIDIICNGNVANIKKELIESAEAYLK